MLVLSFDTSSPAITVAVTRADERGEPVSSDGPGEFELAPNQHGELLAPMISRAIETAGIDLSDLDAIGVGLGPGPFTGLRVGIVTAKAIGDALKIPTYGACSLDSIVVHDYERGVPLAVVTDARRKQVYWRLYDGATPAGAPEIGAPDQVADRLRGRADRVVGAGAELYPEAFAEFDLEWGRSGNGGLLYPSPSGISALVLDRARRRAPSEVLVPLYLRRPDARPPGAPKKVTPV